MNYTERLNPSMRSWVDLTPDKRNALITLGWDATGVRWAHYQTPDLYASNWNDLTPLEEESAVFLGYTLDVWQGCAGETDCITLLELLQATMSTWSWGSMPLGIEQRLEQLGWDAEGWNNGKPPLHIC